MNIQRKLQRATILASQGALELVQQQQPLWSVPEWLMVPQDIEEPNEEPPIYIPQPKPERICSWVGGDKGAWTYCDQPAVGKSYCAGHEAACVKPVKGDLESWIKANTPKEAHAKKVKFATTGLVR